MQLPPSTPQLKGPIWYQPMAIRDLVAFYKEAWGKGRETFGAGPGANKRPPSVAAHSSSSLLLCPLSLEPDARGAQQPAAARDNSLDVRVWWPRAAKNNYLMQGLEYGWKHPQPTGPSERKSRIKMYSSLHRAPALTHGVPQRSAGTCLQCRWFVLLCLLSSRQQAHFHLHRGVLVKSLA